jgi:hypothetical protein
LNSFLLSREIRLVWQTDRIYFLFEGIRLPIHFFCFFDPIDSFVMSGLVEEGLTIADCMVFGVSKKRNKHIPQKL